MLKRRPRLWSSVALGLVVTGGIAARPPAEATPARPAQDGVLEIAGPAGVYASGAVARHQLTLDLDASAPVTVTLSARGDDWPLVLPPPVLVPARGRVTTTVTVAVPFTINGRVADTLEITAASTAGHTAKAQLTTRTGGAFDGEGYVGCRFDFDEDGRITASDVRQVASRFNARPPSPRYDPVFDLDHSGRIGAADAQAVAGRVGSACRVLPVADSAVLRAALTEDGLRRHLEAFQTIAEAQGGHRAAGSVGYAASQSYVADLLGAAGLDVRTQAFPFPYYELLSQPRLTRVEPDPVDYGRDDFRIFKYSPSGDVTTEVQAVDVIIPAPPAENTSTSGCEAGDFAGFRAGRIALLQRGTCGFDTKVRHAEAAGAAGVVVFNEGAPRRTAVYESQLDGPGATVPVFSASYALGEALHALLESGGRVRLHMVAETTSELRPTHNLLAELPGEAGGGVVVLGAHLDSVPAGPGINDNGSGSAAILEIALQMAGLGTQPRNTVRFAFWGAEELGLLGSDHYVKALEPDERRRTLMNLNFDMIASTNYVRFVYDGDGSDSPHIGPEGSAEIEAVFTRFFDGVGLAAAPSAFSGRSDYGPFIAAGIPAGGLFTGTAERKTEEEAAEYGGVAGEPYDPCYHQACDTVDNIAWDVLLQHTHAAADAALAYAFDDGFGYRDAADSPQAGSVQSPDRSALDYWGPLPRR